MKYNFSKYKLKKVLLTGWHEYDDPSFQARRPFIPLMLIKNATLNRTYSIIKFYLMQPSGGSISTVSAEFTSVIAPEDTLRAVTGGVDMDDMLIPSGDFIVQITSAYPKATDPYRYYFYYLEKILE